MLTRTRDFVSFAAVLLALCLCPDATSNPVIAAHRYYVTREDLQVILHKDFADIKGTFEIQDTPRVSGHVPVMPVYIQVPLYVPIATNGLCADFWSKGASAFARSFLPPDVANTLQKLSGIQLEYSNRTVRPNKFRFPDQARDAPIGQPPDGFVVIWAFFELEAQSLKKRDSFRLSYRQYNCVGDKAAWFVYTPLFSDVPAVWLQKGPWSKHSKAYNITVSTPESAMNLMSTHAGLLIRSSQRIVIQPRHLETIHICMQQNESAPQHASPKFECTLP